MALGNESKMVGCEGLTSGLYLTSDCCPDGDATEIHFQTPFGLLNGLRPSSVKVDPSQIMYQRNTFKEPFQILFKMLLGDYIVSGFKMFSAKCICIM
jgi:hypothetical protein